MIVIVGAGPCGLTIAYELGMLGHKCLIIDKNNEVGGFHRAKYVNGLYSENVPHIYSSAYTNTRNLLKRMNVNFFDLFHKCDIVVSDIQTTKPSMSELSCFIIEYVKLMFGIDESKYCTVLQFMNKNRFSESTKIYFDRLCRLTDGMSSDKFLLYELLQIYNIRPLHDIWKSKNMIVDVIRQKALETKNVKTLLNTEVVKVNGNESITVQNGDSTFDIEFTKLVFAVPPKQLYELANHIFPLVTYEWTKNNSYIEYIPCTYHFATKLTNVKYVFRDSEWGVAYIILNDHIVSACASILDVKSKYTGKTANQSDEQEVIEEIFRQLQIHVPYSSAIVSAKKVNNKWINNDTAFIPNDYDSFIPFDSPIYNNVFNVGTQNGYGYDSYPFTTFESAVTNALGFVSHLKGEKYKLTKPILTTDVIKVVIILGLLYLIFI